MSVRVEFALSAMAMEIAPSRPILLRPKYMLVRVEHAMSAVAIVIAPS